MTIELKISDGCATKIKEFKVNGIDAEISDFGTLDADHYGTYCEIHFIECVPTKETLNFYEITEEEYEDIEAILERRFSGGCSMCD